MLSKRDEEMSRRPLAEALPFLQSFFITVAGHTNPAIDGKYEYKNVKRWSKYQVRVLLCLLVCLICDRGSSL
jgi:hypothetical protein